MDSPTVLTSLHSLLRAHTSRPTAQAYLHPYAPSSSASSSSSSSAGKGKAKDIGTGLEDQLSVVRAVKDVIDSARPLLAGDQRIRLVRALREVTTHQAVLMPLATTIYSLNTSHASSSHLLSLSPVDLLTSISKRLGIQTYLEDSQFGLLKTSLTLAGARFVVDIDLETDAATGADDDEADEPVNSGADGEERNRTRLSKLTANHVATGSSTGKSDWVAAVLKGDVEGCLIPRDDPSRVAAIDHLASEMGELRWLDELEGASYYSDLETLAAGVQERIKDGSLYPPEKNTVFPSFRLLPSAGPTLRLRPANSKDNAASEETPAVTSAWEVEVIGSMPVRSSVFGGAASSESTVRVESLIYEAAFPYLVNFVHKDKDQHWSMAQPGPDGFVFGRLPFSTWDAFSRGMSDLRAQAVMNLLVARVFTRGSMVVEQDEEGEEDVEMDADEVQVPLSMTLGDKSITVLFPLVSKDETTSEVVLRILPASTAPYINVECEDGAHEAAVAAARGVMEKLDLVAAVDAFVRESS